MAEISFIKMHGLGNDFVIIDTREHPLSLSTDAIKRICDRHLGVGCDQLVLISHSQRADCRVHFYNADGSESGACGNASRCIASLMMYESGRSVATIATNAGMLSCDLTDDGWITVNMGKAKTSWQAIPLACETDTLHMPLEEGMLKDPVCINVGNPHAVFFVDDVDEVPLKELGPKLEHHSLFPERANIEVVQVVSRSHIRIRVWERGSGETKACGTGACAAAVAAIRRDLCDRTVLVNLLGGDLEVSLHINMDVTLSGPIAISFAGVMDEELWLGEREDGDDA
jgi:diaminopimelate epimerase